MIEYKLIRSKRKSISIQIVPRNTKITENTENTENTKTSGSTEKVGAIYEKNGSTGKENNPDLYEVEVVVRVPLNLDIKEIDRIVKERESWIIKNIQKMKMLMEEQTAENTEKKVEKLTMEEIKALADKALKYIPERVEYYAKIVGVDYGGITIRNQKTRWGSCSSKGNLNFNCLLMLMPPEVIDSVVVHELCHILEMNHSKKFYEHVLRAFPEYEKWDKWLKENGKYIMARMTG